MASTPKLQRALARKRNFFWGGPNGKVVAPGIVVICTIEKTRLSHQVWSHGGSTFKKKRTLNGHFSRPAETDPYDNYGPKQHKKWYETAQSIKNNSVWSNMIQNSHIDLRTWNFRKILFFCTLLYARVIFLCKTRPKPPFGRQGLAG